MDEAREHQKGPRRPERLIQRLDRMVESGRLTTEEAERLRAADAPGEVDDVVLDIRVRHAGAILDAAVRAGSLSQEEADGYLERLRSGEDPRSLRAQLRLLRPGAPIRANLPGVGRRHGDSTQDPARE